MKNLLLLFAFFGTAISSPVFGQLDVKPGNQPPFTPENLVTNFMTSGGINVLSVTYSGEGQSVGYFTGGDTLIGLERGLILTTGSAASNNGATYGADGTGQDFASSGTGGQGTEPNLSTLVSGPFFDVAYYKITFQSYNDSIRFRYVFASEEYPEYACTQFNDVFGFFLEGPGYATPLNIAMIPGTNLPVAINNIHPINPNAPLACNPAFEQYYTDNSSSSQQPVYDGILDPFVAEAAVEPCGIYTMTIAIADVGDAAFDSGVFLEANSFGSSSFVDASFGPGSNVLPEGSTGLPVSLTFSQIPPSVLPLTVSFGGDAVEGTDYSASSSTFTINSMDSVLQFSIQPLEDTLAEVVETVVVNVTGGNCFVKTFELFITDPGTIFKSEDTLNLVGTLTLGGDISSAENTVYPFSNETDLTIEPVNTSVISSIDVQGIPLEKLTDPAVIESVCLNINHSWLDDINVFLMAPDGKYMELTTNNGASGDNYTSTCFSPSATAPIDFGLGYAPASAAPFTGVFQPEGKWSDLAGGNINGTWSLIVMDDATGFTGTVQDWSITFNTALAGNFKYNWSTGETTKTIDVQAPGIYTVTVSNAVSSYSKNYLVKAPCGFSQQSYTICHGESVVVNGVTYNENNNSGEQLFTISPGCDSVLLVQVHVLPELNQVINATVCDGATYTFGNEIISEGGTYQQSLTSVAGCDSLVTLHLDIAPKYTTDLQAVICNGASYQFGNAILTESGTYTNQLQTINGCDSLVVLNLQVQPVAIGETSASICAGETFGFNGLLLSDAGDYTVTLPTSTGCDSLSILHLSVLQASSDSIFVVLQLGEVFEAGGMQFSEFGDFIVHLEAANGCDSTLFIHIDIVDGVINPDISQLVTISPNPAHGAVNIQWPADLNFEQITVRTADQRTMLSQSAAALSGNAVIDVSNWQSGLYIVEMSGPSGNAIQKMIKI